MFVQTYETHKYTTLNGVFQYLKTDNQSTKQTINQSIDLFDIYLACLLYRHNSAFMIQYVLFVLDRYTYTLLYILLIILFVNVISSYKQMTLV
jgi:hypothetical protein